MNKPDFVYTTYIKTTPEKLWAAITNPEFTSQYWVSGITSDWEKGSTWQQVSESDQKTVYVGGEVLESNPPHHLVLTWAEPATPEDGSKVSFNIEAFGDMVCLTVRHGGFKENSQMAGKVAFGWPRVLSSLKSLLETGNALDTWVGHQNACGNSAAKEAA